MKALLVNGSPRAKGCTYTALTELAKTLESEGIEAEIVHVGNKEIRGCVACRKCHEPGGGLQTMRTLGRNMAFLMKSIQMGKEKMGLPEKEPAIFTNFHH